MKTRIIVYSILALFITAGLFYVATKEQVPTGLSRGRRTYTFEIMEEPEQQRQMEREDEDSEDHSEYYAREYEEPQQDYMEDEQFQDYRKGEPKFFDTNPHYETVEYFSWEELEPFFEHFFLSREYLESLEFEEIIEEEPPMQLIINDGDIKNLKIREWLNAHNKYRAMHGVPPLMWDQKLAKSAQKWADYLKKTGAFKHSSGSYGENLIAGQFSSLDAAVKYLYDEIKKYNFASPGFSNDTGHFTQIVWKGTERIGVGIGYPYPIYGTVYVIQYDPPGNYSGSFQNNVLKPKRSETACTPDKIFYSPSKGKWVSGTDKCWQIDGDPVLGTDIGRDSSKIWTLEGATPSVKTCGGKVPPLGLVWKCSAGGGYWPVGGIQYYKCNHVWALKGYSLGAKIPPGQQIKRYNPKQPDIRGIRVDGKSACWEKLDASGKDRGILYCEY